MKELEKFPSSMMQIRFQDCDPMSHLNNGRYIDYFMNAREDHLASYYGINIYNRLKENGQSWVVVKNEIIYRKPAFLMEDVLIKTQVNNFSLKHIEVEMTMYDDSGSKLKSIMRCIFIPFDIKTNSVAQHDDEIMTLLKSVRVENIHSNLEERITEIEGKLTLA